MSEREVAAFVANAEGHPKGCMCERCVPSRAIIATVANRIFESCLEHAPVARDQIAADADFSAEVANKVGVDRAKVTAVIENLPLDQLASLVVGIRVASIARHPSINHALHIETVTSLNFIQALEAARRAGKWDNIKTLSGPEADACREAMVGLRDALPATIEEMDARKQVSVDQGEKSLRNKAAKKAARKVAKADPAECANGARGRQALSASRRATLRRRSKRRQKFLPQFDPTKEDAQ